MLDALQQRERRKVRSSRPWDRTVRRVLRTKGTICHLCGKPGADTADHLIPVAVGLRQGMTRTQLNAINNLAPAHNPCNARRGTKPVDSARREAQGVRTSRDW
jgi:5-methylcytosine-specific restriction endonuclease McrA